MARVPLAITITIHRLGAFAGMVWGEAALAKSKALVIRAVRKSKGVNIILLSQESLQKNFKIIGRVVNKKNALRVHFTQRINSSYLLLALGSHSSRYSKA